MSYRMIGVTALFTVIAFLFNGNAPIGAMIWPPEAGAHGPSAGQLPFFMVLTLISSIAFGAGVAFLIYGWSTVNAVKSQSRSHALGLYLATAWLLLNWVPHENLHIANGMNMQGLLYIEYGFHVTLIVAGLAMFRGLSHFAGQVLRLQNSHDQGTLARAK